MITSITMMIRRQVRLRLFSVFIHISCIKSFSRDPSPRHASCFGREKESSYFFSDVRRSALEGIVQLGFGSLLIATMCLPNNAVAIVPLINNGEMQGIPIVTQSDLGTAVRESIVRGAQLADQVDLRWERFSDGLRDEKKCDPLTKRRLFDNGRRKDGSRIGNPVLGALCSPEPLKDVDLSLATTILDLGKDAAAEILQVPTATLEKKQLEVSNLVEPAFARAGTTLEGDVQGTRRQTFNRDLYTQTRAYGELIQSRSIAKKFERNWGDRILKYLAPDAKREDFKSPFPTPDDNDLQPYDEGALLDALGSVSKALEKLQQGGLIGHWEISIPEDDAWSVVTLAVDDDISIGGQIIGRERNQPLSGSEIVALVRSAMENQAKISYKMDVFFIDPSTTRQELYNPTQLLVSLSELGS
jgi:hypothetical protein